MFRDIPAAAFNFHSIVRIRDIDAVLCNYRILKAKAHKTNSACGVVLKGNVHGLGIRDVAPVLYEDGARLFFVEEVSEGVELREILPEHDAKIFVMAGLLKGEEDYFTQYRLIPCLNSINQISRWNQYCADGQNCSAVIHLDTHMNRIGLLDDDVKYLSKNYINLTTNITIDFYMSHLASVKSTDSRPSYQQLAILKDYLTMLPPNLVSLSCTDGMVLLDNTEFNFDLVRPGIGLVGGGPNSSSPISENAKHTIEIYAKFSQVKHVKKGSKIGYGCRYTAASDMKIALVHIGYKDGYLSTLSETDDCRKGAYMYLDGYKLPVVGRVSLGVTTIDISSVPSTLLDEYNYVEVVGPNVDIKYLADIGGCYEILMALGRPNKKVCDYTLKEYNAQFSD